MNLLTIVWLRFALVASLFVSPVYAKKPPNVIFLAVDDMNDWIGCLNTTPGAITPNIDKLAQKG